MGSININPESHFKTKFSGMSQCIKAASVDSAVSSFVSVSVSVSEVGDEDQNGHAASAGRHIGRVKHMAPMKQANTTVAPTTPLAFFIPSFSSPPLIPTALTTWRHLWPHITWRWPRGNKEA